jgi:hypothetical protein
MRRGVGDVTASAVRSATQAVGDRRGVTAGARRGSPFVVPAGCIRSDGCVFINRTGRYTYESYDFTNLSRDIRELLASTCGSVGVDHRVYARRVRIYRRASVALMLEHVGRRA